MTDKQAFISEEFTVIDDHYSFTVIALNGDKRAKTDFAQEGRRFAKLLRLKCTGAFLRGMLAELRSVDPELFDPEAQP